MLSIPRELRVTITAANGEVVTNRINSAYTYGGIELMLKTIKHVFGLSVNHVFVVTFPKFRRAVNEMGCVYMTVDRRYYHINEPGGEQYFEINLQPGYQRLCGKEALEFVANRHEDTSLTRDARDQRFLLEIKSQYGANLFESVKSSSTSSARRWKQTCTARARCSTCSSCSCSPRASQCARSPSTSTC